MRLHTISKIAVVIALLLGLGMVVLGATFMLMGYDAKGDIQAALLKEKVITSADSAIPGVLVEDVRTAKAQQDSIESHTFGRFGPYSGMERDDPKPGRVPQRPNPQECVEPGYSRIWRS